MGWVKKLLPWTLILVSTVAYPKDVKLSWDPSPTASVIGYNLYWGTQSSPPFPNKVIVGDSLTYHTIGLPDSETHWFAVTAYDAFNNESAYSNVVKSDIMINTLPELDLSLEWHFLLKGQ